MWLGGTYEALPKGASSIRSRNLLVRVGPPLRLAEMRRLTEGLTNTERTRVVTRLMQRAVEELSRGKQLATEPLSPADVRGL
jgi:long-chain acyl-CoA synthetase